MFHCDNDISLFVSCIDIPVGLNNLFQRIAFINNRFDLPRLDEFFEEDQIFRFWRGSPTDEFLAACH